MEKSITIDGYTFELDGESSYYQCRGETCYDDEHDECAEEGLWDASEVLVKRLEKMGIDCYNTYSEKGWVEVEIQG